MSIPRLCLAASSVLGFSTLAKEDKVPVENPSLESVLKDLDNTGGPNAKSLAQQKNEELQKAITSAKNLCWIKMSESAIPGLIIAVSVDGKTVFKHGFGYADVENRVLATPSHVMRIASISKPLAMVAAARLYQDGKLDLDKPISDYVTSWPEKHPKITAKHLASHTSGVRHYKEEKGIDDEKKKTSHDTKYPEFYSNKRYSTIEKALEVFKDDDLLCEPGAEFHYTTHGFTVLSAVIESAAKEPFAKHMKKLFKTLGLNNTYLDENEPIIPFRAKYYQRDAEHKLKNVPAVDNSLKWAGGGFLSTVGDLLQFGNAMLYSYQFSSKGNEEQTKPKDVVFTPTPYSAINERKEDKLPPLLEQETIQKLWTPVIKTSPNGDGHYGLGWAIMEEKSDYAFCKKQRFYASHTGGAVGASSVLLIFPRKIEENQQNSKVDSPPQGIVVAIVCNLQSVGLSKLALDVAKTFENIPKPSAQRVRKVYEC